MSLRGLFDRSVRRAAPPPADTQDFDLTLGNAAIRVRVRRHARATRLRLRYDRAKDELRLTVPPRIALAKARQWAGEQQDWIVRQRGAAEQGMIIVGNGAVLPWRGGSLTIDWAADLPRAPHLDGGLLRLGGPESAVAGRVQRWLIEQARNEFTQATHDLAGRAGLRCSGVGIGDPRSRWGSCTSAAAIRYSWRLVMAPDFVRQAIVAHEVAHIAHLHHGPAFYDLVEQLVPNVHDRSRAWLRAHGPSLHAVTF